MKKYFKNWLFFIIVYICASHVNTVSESYDDEPQIKLPLFEKSGRVIPMSGIVPSMTMPEFTIDRDVRHFITSKVG